MIQTIFSGIYLIGKNNFSEVATPNSFGCFGVAV